MNMIGKKKGKIIKAREIADREIMLSRLPNWVGHLREILRKKS